MDAAAGVLAAVIVVFVIAVSASSNRTAMARTPRGIMRRLKQPGDRVTISATGIAGNPGVWNPSKPLGAKNYIRQPGVATYWLGDDGQVHLDWQSRYGHQQYVGTPLPPEIPHESSNRIMLWTVLGGGLGGLAIGYLFSIVGEVGPHPDRRVLLSMAGLAVALLVLICFERILFHRHRRGGIRPDTPESHR